MLRQLMNSKMQTGLNSLFFAAWFFLAAFFSSELAASLDKLKPPAVAMECIQCHAAKNTAAPRVYPKLAGQQAKYIVRQILDFQGARRIDPVMSPIAEKLNRQTIGLIADYFSQQPVMPEKQQGDHNGDKGRVLYIEHNCNLCHHAKAMQENLNLPHGPVIAGQIRDYLVKAMHDIKNHKRPSDVFELMHRILDEISDADIAAMADYISTHTPAELQQ